MGKRNLVGMKARWIAVAVAAVTAFACLATAVMVGVRLPALSVYRPFEGVSALNYRRPPTGFETLDLDFVRRALGITLPASTPGAATSASPRRKLGSSPGFDVERFVDIHRLTNDDIATARPVPAGTFTAKTDTRSATDEPGREPASCSGVGGSVWYRYSPAGDIPLFASTFGSSYGTALGIFTKAGDAWTEVGCDIDREGNSLVQFTALKGTTYWFRIDAQTTGGDLVFNLDPQGDNALASVASDGTEADAPSLAPTMSADGRYIAFESLATNLVPGNSALPCQVIQGSDSIGPDSTFFNIGENLVSSCSHVYVFDRKTHTIERISVSSTGEVGNGSSDWAFISGNGRFVAFRSQASNLVPSDANRSADIFIHDRRTGRTEIVSVSSSGAQAFAPVKSTQMTVDFPSVSHDGRFVAFESTADNLVEGDTNRSSDVFVRDRLKHTTDRVSVSSVGAQAETTIQGVKPVSEEDVVASYIYGLMVPFISADGRFVEFRSTASNLVPDDKNEYIDTFVHDRLTRTTERVSISSTGEEAERPKTQHIADPADPNSVAVAAERLTPHVKQGLSADGRYALFVSMSPNLVPGDCREEAVPGECKNWSDVFIRDRWNHTTTRVSVTSSGEPAAGHSYDAGISPNGRFIAFTSAAKNLGSSREGAEDVFIHDLWTQTTTRLPLNAEDQLGEVPSLEPWLSADGSVIAFEARALRNYAYFTQVLVHRRHVRGA